MFKYKLTRYLFIVGILFATVLGFSDRTYASVEAINNFDARIEIEKDASVLVSEKITYDFGTNERHGIFRDIPLATENGPQLDVNIMSVSDELGYAYLYNVSILNNAVHVKIGNPDSTVSGRKTYVIKYLVYNAIRTFSDHDEFYWNVTGDRWLVPIDKASASIVVFDPSLTDPKMACFTGPVKSVLSKCTFGKGNGSFDYSTTGDLKSGEGFTVVFGMPSGYVKNTYIAPNRPSSYGGSADNIYDVGNNGMFDPILLMAIIFIFAIVIILIVLSLRGDIRTKLKPNIPKELIGLPIVVEYNPPDNLPPIEVGTLIDRKVDVTDISSVIMDLAVRGYLKIKHISISSFLSKQNDFELIRLKDGADLNYPADKIIFDLLFGHNDHVKLSELQNSGTVFQEHIEKITDKTEEWMRDEGYFAKIVEGTKEPKGYLGVLKTLGLIIGTFVVGIVFGRIGLLTYISIIVIIIFIRSLMDTSNKLTPKGIAVFAKVLGFREFLQLTEKDKLELLNAPELHPETFEKFLPYAMALGVEDKWAKKFDGIYNTMPNWYEDPTMSVFNSFALINNLTYFDIAFNNVFNITSPRSTSGFSSGFGGGGFSGGGSGGGGGGSW